VHVERIGEIREDQGFFGDEEEEMQGAAGEPEDDSGGL
jgi:hypothetical protein